MLGVAPRDDPIDLLRISRVELRPDHRVEHAVHRGVERDRERERQDCHRGEAPVERERANGETEVLAGEMHRE
jgi:hypothetical protein